MSKKLESVENQELHTAHSNKGAEDFRSGGELRKEYLHRVEEITNPGIKDDAISGVAKMFYEVDGDLDGALEWASKIIVPNFRTHCFTQIAVMILKKEGNFEKADSVIEKIPSEDRESFRTYIDSYQKIKQEVSNKSKI